MENNKQIDTSADFLLKALYEKLDHAKLDEDEADMLYVSIKFLTNIKGVQSPNA